MSADTELRIKALEERLQHMWKYLDLDGKLKSVADFEKQMEAGSFWDDSESAQKVISECNAIKAWTVPAVEMKKKLEGVASLLPEAEEMGDDSLVAECLSELDIVEETLTELEMRRMLSGELDNKHCYLTINSGAGGTEACDWVSMLFRMYQRWVTKRGWKGEIVDQQEGDVAGLKSVTLKIDGDFAYGYSKSERGVHRLVRISPFDSSAKRHTSFASVDISPEITDDVEIEVRSEDIRVDTFCASGPGGQHVNKTKSAVRITHEPSGVVVSCQAQRSQMQNKEQCMKMLKSRLYQQKVEEKEAELRALSGEKKEIAWGSQIRNYVFQPYTLVKDTRTKVEVGNIESVMDGEIDPFVNAYLKEFGGA